MKTLILISLVAFVLADSNSNKALEKGKNKRTPVGQGSLNGAGGSYLGGSYATPSSQYNTPSAAYSGTPSANYLPQYSGNTYAAPSASYGAAGLNYGVPSLSYLPSHMYGLQTLNLPLAATGGAFAHNPAAAHLGGDLGLLQQSYFLQPSLQGLFTPQLDFTSLYSGLQHGYPQFANIQAAPVQAATTKLGPVTFGAGHGGLADLGLYAQQIGQNYQTPSQSSYSSPAASYTPNYSTPSQYSASGTSSSYTGGSQAYSLPSTYSSPTSSYSSPSYSSGSSAYSSPSSSYSPSSAQYSSSYSPSSSSYSSPSSSYSSPSSSYSSPSSSYSSPSSSPYNTINYSKH